MLSRRKPEQPYTPEQYNLNPAVIPQHIGIIMDGNGRWAKKQGFPRHEGHKAGSDNLENIAGAACDFGVKALSVYAFSTENWCRPESEITALMNLIAAYLKRPFPKRFRNRVKMKVSGDITRLPKLVQMGLHDWITKTSNNTEMTLNVCLNYGGRDEIVRAARACAEEVKNTSITVDMIDENYFAGKLFTAELPELDLLIRTSGEFRVSNYMLWQIAYAEIVVTDILWPDFSVEEFARCIGIFQQRDRRLGGL